MNLYKVSFTGPAAETPELQAELKSLKFEVLADSISNAVEKAGALSTNYTLTKVELNVTNFDEAVLK
jgi:hypothetical protein